VANVIHRDLTTGELHEAKRHKANVRAASIATVTLASAVENGDTLDGVTLATGNRILLKNQSAGAENGVYTVNASGAPTRATDADAAAELFRGFLVYVEEGTQAGTVWAHTTTAAITLGTTALTFAQVGSSGTPASSVVSETAYGQSTAVGSSTNYARQDHSHGSPALGSSGSTAAAGNHTHAAADIASGTIATARLGGGTADATTFLRGDQTYATPAGGGGSGNTVTVANVSGSTIPKGSAVYWTAAVDGSGNVKVGKLTSGEASAYFGMLTGDLLAAGTATCQTSGVVTGLDTSGFTAGDLLYLNGSGVYQLSQSGIYVHLIGMVKVSHATTGSILMLRLVEGGDMVLAHAHSRASDGGQFGVSGAYSLPVFTEVDFTTVPTPPAGDQIVGIDSNDQHLKRKNSSATVVDIETAGGGGAFVGASVYLSFDQSIANNTNTPASWGSEAYDTDSLHDNAVNPERLTVNATGYWRVSGFVEFDINSTGYRAAYLAKNGSYENQVVEGPSTSATTQWGAAFSFTKYLVSGDYLELIVKQTSGGALNLIGTPGETIFQIELVGS
jgi:hypothetical protein